MQVSVRDQDSRREMTAGRPASKTQHNLPESGRVMNTLSSWVPFRELEELQEHLGTYMGRAPYRPATGPVWPAAMPEVEVQEKDGEYELKVQLPGFRREDIELTRQDSILSLRGESQRLVESLEGKRAESVSFTRQFVLPDNAAEKLITAEFGDGELTVFIPKTAAPPVQKVEVTMV